MQTDISFGLIGCGKIGVRHAEQISRDGHLAAVCDLVAEKADSLAGKYGAKAYYNIDSLLTNEKRIHVVCICTPNGLHAEHSIKSLLAGHHVLCEKPMAISAEDCRMMIKAEKDSGKLLFIVKQNRFNPPVIALKELIDGNFLGRVFSFQLSCFWNRSPEYYEDKWRGSLLLDGGTLFTQFSHFIDLIYWLFGEIDHIKGYIGNYSHAGIIEFEDTGVGILKFQNGVLGTLNYTVNSYQTNMEGSLTVFGEKGTIKIGGQYLNVLEYQNIQDFKISSLPIGNEPNNYGHYWGSMSNHDKVYRNLVEALMQNEEIATNSIDGMKTVEIIERFYRAAKWISVPNLGKS